MTRRTDFLIGNLRAAGIVSSLLLLLAACSKDPMDGTGPRGRGMHFGIEVSGAWQPGTAAASAANASERPDTLCGACTHVYTLQGPAPADTLFLHAAVDEGVVAEHPNEPADRLQTRSTPVETHTFYDSFGAMAYVYSGSWSDALTPDYMYDVEITKASGWTATDYNWPGKGRKIRFFAYAPYKGRGVALSGNQNPGAPQITYTTPAAVEDQQDLLVAAPAEMDGAPAPDKEAALTFAHALTAVRFVTGDNMMAGRITKITLKNVYGKAVYNMGTAQWSGFTSSSSFSQTLSKEVDGTPGEEITPAPQTFMMIPQKLPSNAAIEVVYTDKLTSTQRTLTAKINGSEWPVGKTVIYRISTTSISLTPTFTVTPPADFTYAGGTATYTVDSRTVVTRPGDPEKSVPLAWTAEFVEDDGTGGYRVIAQPGWITAFTTNGDGGTAALSYTAQVAAQTAVTSNPHNDILQKAQDVNRTSGHTPYNLANATGAEEVQNTANCYIVNAPGKYSLPLVYGNAIKDGSTNASAYTSSASGANVLQKFINHLGAAITDPYIYNNANCVPADATLVWQDRPSLVTGVELTPDGRSLTFEVQQPYIGQGNAILAVRNAAKQIMWSWHIWVTDYVPGLAADKDDPMRDKVVTNFQNVKYTFMPINLGWCNIETISYDARTTKVRFAQAGTGATQIIEIAQIPSLFTFGNAPYYQWGRKDPTLPAANAMVADKTNKTWYDATGTASTTQATANWPANSTTITNGILNPATFCTNSYMEGTYHNLWSANNTGTTANDAPVVKTIYDPSPVGYHLPASNAFTGFTYNGNDVEGSYYGTRFNSPYTSENDFTTNGGWIFYCNRMNGQGQYDTTGGTIFYPASGYRNTTRGLCYVREFGYYWTCVPQSVQNSRALNFIMLSKILPLGNNWRAYGFSIRPVQE